MYFLFPRHQRRPLGRRVGRSCCPSPASFFKAQPLSCRVSSRAARRPRDQAALQARRGVPRGVCCRTPLGRGCRGPTLPAQLSSGLMAERSGGAACLRRCGFAQAGRRGMGFQGADAPWVAKFFEFLFFYRREAAYRCGCVAKGMGVKPPLPVGEGYGGEVTRERKPSALGAHLCWKGCAPGSPSLRDGSRGPGETR